MEQGSLSWKVLDLFPKISWKVLEIKVLRACKSWNLLVVQINQHALYVQNTMCKQMCNFFLLCC